MNTSEAHMSASTIKKQIGVMGLAVVGAHQFAYTKDGGLTFKARLHFRGQTRVRISRITVTPNALDLYDVDVTSLPRSVSGQERKARYENVYADMLTDLMHTIDAEGF